MSPVLGKGGKKVTAKQLSPKLRKKSFKTQADVQRASVPSSYSRVDQSDAPAADGKDLRAAYQHSSPLSTTSQASATTDLSHSAQNLPDPGQCHYS